MEVGVFQGASVGLRPWDVSEPLRIRRDVEIGVAADAAGFDIGALVANVAGGGVGGAVLLAIVSFLKKAMASKP